MMPLMLFQERLKELVKGQDAAIDQLSTALFKYLLKLHAPEFGITFTGASSMLFIGESGCGKTFLIKQAAELSHIPFIEINAKSISQEGWEGSSFLKLVSQGFDAAGDKTGGIIFIDEFDKLCSTCASSTNDDVNYHIQASMLKYIEGMKTMFQNKTLNFNRCMFVFSGAFEGMDLGDKKLKIGFGHSQEEQIALNEALVNYGMLKEVCGRIQEKVFLNPITRDVYEELLVSPDFILQNWTELLKRLDIEVTVNYNILIDEAIKSKLGVRGLIQAVEARITEIINLSPEAACLDNVAGIYKNTNVTND